MADQDEQGSGNADTSRLASLREAYASWLVEGMRWSCRAQEHDDAIADLLSGTDIGAAEIADEADFYFAQDDIAALIRHVPTQALQRERQCILQHA
ncbi:hypothetical protein BST61_g11477 [Cercospora zeina]